MEENKITAITKERTDMLRKAYKDTLEILDAYDHQTLTVKATDFCPITDGIACP